MKLLDILKTANSNLLRNKARSFLTILAIFIGSFTIILTTGIQTGVNDYIDKQIDSVGGQGYIEIMPEALMSQAQGMMSGGSNEPQEYSPEKNGADMQVISEADLEKIRAIDHIGTVSGFQQVSAEYIGSDETDKRFTLRVQMMQTDRIRQDVATGRMVDIKGDTPEITLQPGFAKALGFGSDEEAVGKKVIIGVANLATNEISHTEATVSGVLNQSIISLGRNWINSALGEKILDIQYAGLPDSYRNMIYVAIAEFDTDLDEAGIQEIKDQLKELGFIGMTVNDQVGMIKSFFDAIITVFTIFGGIALLAASIGIINTLFMAVQERTREIGLMKAMGLGKGKIFLMFSFEAIFLGFWGSVVGVGLAIAAGTVANHVAAETFLSGLPGFTLIKFEVVSLVIVALIIMAIAFLAGTLPARRAAGKDPIDALRYE